MQTQPRDRTDVADATFGLPAARIRQSSGRSIVAPQPPCGLDGRATAASAATTRRPLGLPILGSAQCVDTAELAASRQPKRPSAPHQASSNQTMMVRRSSQRQWQECEDLPNTGGQVDLLQQRQLLHKVLGASVGIGPLARTVHPWRGILGRAVGKLRFC
jgi:hypothetical protein